MLRLSVGTSDSRPAVSRRHLYAVYGSTRQTASLARVHMRPAGADLAEGASYLADSFLHASIVGLTTDVCYRMRLRWQ